MGKSEPALAPEWLRSSGSLTGGGNSTHHFLSSSHSDVASLGHHNRNRTSKGISDFDTSRSPFLDRSSSSNSRRSSSSNGSAKHAYSSFSRSHRDRDRDREKERSSFGDHWYRDCSNPLGSMFPRVENDTLRLSQSLVTRKQDELVQRKASVDSKLGLNNNHYNGNGTHLGVNTAGLVHKVVFEKDFPSLVNEERQVVPDVGRVLSPGLSTAAQSLPASNSSLIGEGWRSALVEVPPLPIQQIPVGLSVSGATTNTVAGLNMAEALVQAAPSQSISVPQMQRREELFIKQSKQLVPVTPMLPKIAVLSSSDKSKPKLVARSGEMVSAAKSGQQQQPSSMHPVNQSQRVGNVKSDVSKTSHGKFLVLKPVRESGISTGPRDVTSPPNSASSKIANSQPSPTAAPPLVASASIKSQNIPKLSTVERKSLNPGPILDKKPSSAQSQSRKDFLNLMRKKSSINNVTVLPDPGSEITSLTEEKSSEVKKVVGTPASPHSIENDGEVSSNGITCEESQRFANHREHNLSPDMAVYPDEEEAAFLRSLGWEENAGEDEGLTEEEINAFYQEYMKLRPPLKLCGSVLPKLAAPTESHATGMRGDSSEVSSSDSGSDV